MIKYYFQIFFSVFIFSCLLLSACATHTRLKNDAYQPQTIADKIERLEEERQEQLKKQSEETKELIEEEGYSIIPPTATEAIQEREHTDLETLRQYRQIIVNEWHYITRNMDQGVQALTINLPDMIPDLNLNEVKVGVGMPLVRSFQMHPDTWQCVYFSIGKPLYLKTALMAIRIYGNLIGLFEPKYIVATKRYPGETKEHWWEYHNLIPMPIDAEKGHKAIEYQIEKELGRYKRA